MAKIHPSREIVRILRERAIGFTRISGAQSNDILHLNVYILHFCAIFVVLHLTAVSAVCKTATRKLMLHSFSLKLGQLSNLLAKSSLPFCFDRICVRLWGKKNLQTGWTILNSDSI